MRPLCLVLLSTVCVMGCRVDKSPITKNHIHGIILSLDASAHTATIKHGNIEGFMEAMTMEFPVKDPAEYAKLRSGETIDGTVFVQDTNFWVGDVTEAKP